VACRVGAVDACALGGKATADVAHVLLGDRDLELDDGLQDLGPGLGDRVEEGLAAGGHERDLLAVDAVVLAVVHGHPDVLQRVAGNRAAGEYLAHALLDRRDELSGNDAALDLVGELEAAAARQRFDPQEHLAELPGTAGLLLVPVVSLGLAADRLAIGDAWRMGL